MPSVKPPSRKSSHSNGDPRGDRASDRKAISSTELRVTFENVIHSVSMYPGDTLDKSSVIKCLRSMYDWMVFDSDMQLDMPAIPGSSQTKMWPHGAKVDTRRRPDATVGEESSRRLKEVEKGFMVHVASSVVSSSPEDRGPVNQRGEVMVTAPEGATLVQRPRVRLQPSSVGSTRPAEHIRVVPETYHQGNGPQREPYSQFYQQPNRAYYPVPLDHHDPIPSCYSAGAVNAHTHPPDVSSSYQEQQPALSARRAVPRYSVLGGTAPPAVVEETPEMAHVEALGRAGRRRERGKPKIGTVRRSQDDDGEPVTFADA